MAIGSAVQRGSIVIVYDEKGRQLFTLSVGLESKNGLVGYTSGNVSIRRGSVIYTYNERGQQISTVFAPI